VNGYDELSREAVIGRPVAEPAAAPGKQTLTARLPPTGKSSIGSRPGPAASLVPPDLASGPGLPAPGAEPFHGDDGEMWILRNDGAFECIQAAPTKVGRLHAVVDPDAAAWHGLSQKWQAHAGGRAVPAPTGDVTALFDSPHHIGIGESVEGVSVTVHEVTFSPGELAALVDYVGDLKNLYTYKTEQLLEMQALLRAGDEDAGRWDAVTGGNYSKESQANEKHFAPGGGGANFEDMFIASAGSALATAFQVRSSKDPSDPINMARMEQARLELYNSEHYLQDAFSAGHQVAATDVEAAVDGVMQLGDIAWMTPIIAGEVFAKSKAVISCYGRMTALGWDRIDTPQEFVDVATVGGWLLGRAPLYDAMRKFIHEELDRTGVEVSSPAQTRPWTLPGDHSLDVNKSPETVAALQLALAEVRGAFAGTLDAPGNGWWDIARNLFKRHRPVPTATGNATVADALRRGTSSKRAFMDAIVVATSTTIEGAMDYLVTKSLGLVFKELERPPVEPLPKPEIPDFDPDAPRCPTPPPGGTYRPDDDGDSYGPGGDAGGEYTDGTSAIDPVP
jgi:hypothetical protein